MNTLTTLTLQLEQADYDLRHNTLVYKHDRLLKRYILACKALSSYQTAVLAQTEVAAYARELDLLDESQFLTHFEESSILDEEIVSICAEYGI